MKTIVLVLALLCGNAATLNLAYAGLASSTVRESSEAILAKFGKGMAGRTVDEVAESTTKAVAMHGDEALPFLKKAGHTGFSVLNEAGEKAPDVLKLYARKGDGAIWLISDPKKLGIFLKHGDSAADALLKHPGIADDIISRYGNDGIGALNAVSREGGQRLGILAGDGLLFATPRSTELLPVIRRYGDEAMDFIWKNKGALAFASVLTKFLADPEAFISGVQKLLGETLIAPIINGTNWTLIILAILSVMFGPTIVRSMAKARFRTKPGFEKS